MKVNFNTNGILADISKELTSLEHITEKQEKTAMKKIGNVIKKNIIKNLPTSDEDKANYDGSKPYAHMKDSVKVTVKSKNGFASVTVGGDRKTAFKYHLINDGTLNPDGTVHTKATHFLDKSVIESKSDIDSIIDDLAKAVANGE